MADPYAAAYGPSPSDPYADAYKPAAKPKGFVPTQDFAATMDAAYGPGKWKDTGGYRTPQREAQLRAQGAATVPAGRTSRHSLGTPDAPGAHDIVVPGMDPSRAAHLLPSGYTGLPEGRAGGQGAHLHVNAPRADQDPYAVAYTQDQRPQTPSSADPYAAAYAQPPKAQAESAAKPKPETLIDTAKRIYGPQLREDIDTRKAWAVEELKTSQANAAYNPNEGGDAATVRTLKSLGGLAAGTWDYATAGPKGFIDATLGRQIEKGTKGTIPRQFAADTGETIGSMFVGGGTKTAQKTAGALAGNPAEKLAGDLAHSGQAAFAPATMSEQARDVAHYIRRAGGRGNLQLERTAKDLLKFDQRVQRGTVEGNRALISFIEGRSSHPVEPGEKGAFVPRPDGKSFTLSPSEWKAMRAAGITTPDVEIANKIRDAYKGYRDQAEYLIARNQGAAPQFIKDYYAHIWKENPETVEQRMNSYFSRQGSGRNFRKRTIPTMEEGIAAGLTPKYDNPIEATIVYSQNMSRFLTTHDVQGWMKQEGHAKWFSPGQQPDGWVPLNGIMTERVPRRVRVKTGFEGPQQGEPLTALPGPGQKKLSGAGPQGRLGEPDLKEAPQQGLLGGPEAGKAVERTAGRPGDNARRVGGSSAAQIEDAGARAKNVTPGPEKAKKAKEPTPDRAPRKEVLYAPPDAARVYNNWISKGLESSTTVGRGFEGARKLTNALTAMKLGLSAFHGVVMAQEAAVSSVARGVQAGSRGDIGTALKGVAKAPVALASSGLRGRRMGQELLGLKTATPLSEKINQLYVDSGGRLRMDKLYRATDSRSFYDAFKSGTFRKELASAFDRVAGPNRSMMERGKGTVALAGNIVQSVFQGPLFEDVIPAVKRGAFAERMEDFIKSNPGISDKELERYAVKLNDSMDNRFGELVQDNLFWRKEMKQVAQLLLMSPTWDIGTVREIGGGLIDVLGPSAKGVLQGKGVTDRTAYVAALAATVAVENAIMTYMKTGKPPKDTRDLMAYRTGGTDTRLGAAPERAITPGYQKDIFAAADALTPGSNGPLGELRNKLSPGAAAVLDAATNSDYAGHAIYGPGARQGAALDEALDSLMPISVGQFSRGKTKGSNISDTEKALAIRPAPLNLTNPSALEAIHRHKLMQEKQKAEASHRRQMERQEP